MRASPRTTAFVLAGLTFVVASAWSITRHRTGYTNGYDLGIFTQIADRYAHLRAPDVSLKLDGNALGDHFSPALALLGLPYRVVPRPETLLVVQAFLIALSVVPVVRTAADLLGPPAAIPLGIAYAGSYGLQSLIGFDFHEVSFAVPLLAFGLRDYLGGRLDRAAIVIGALVFVKEDLGLTVALFAALLWPRDRRLSVGLLAWAAGWFLVACYVVIPALSTTRSDRYVHRFIANGALTSHGVAALWSDGRPFLLLMVLLAGSVVALRSPLSLLALGTLSWRLLSVGPGYMTTHAHYDAVLMPIMALAAVDGARRLPRCWRQAFPWAALVVTGAVILAGYPYSRLTDAGFYRANPRVAAVRALIRQVPAGTAIRADNNVASQVVSRNRTYLLSQRMPLSPPTTWVVTDVALSSLDATAAWKQAYLRELRPYTVHRWQRGSVVVVELRAGAPRR